MKKNNKGYTLVELLVTIAIFSIVMIAISSIMSNASKSYKKGLIEVKVQEEAQIVTNQISDLLVDATSIVERNTVTVGEGEDASSYTTYNFKDADNNPISLEYDKNKLYIYKDSEKALLSDNVKSFVIKGVKGTSLVEAQKSDNLCEIEIEFAINKPNSNESETSYKTSREVSFRNQIENNPSSNVLLINASSSDDSDKDDFNGTETVKFGAPINLSASYDIVSDCVLSGPAATYYELDSSGTAFGKPVYKVKLKPAYDNPASFKSLNINSNDIYLSGKDSNNVTKKIKLETEPVSFSAESGILLLTLDNVNHGGGNTTYVPVKGIDVNEFIKSGGTVKVKTEVIVHGNSFAGDWKTLQYSNANDVAYNQSGIGQINVKWNGESNKGRFEIGLSADQCSGGMSIVTNNTAYFKETGSLPTDTKIKFTVELSKNGHTEQYPIEYTVQFTEQQDISKFN